MYGFSGHWVSRYGVNEYGVSVHDASKCSTDVVDGVDEYGGLRVNWNQVCRYRPIKYRVGEHDASKCRCGDGVSKRGTCERDIGAVL
jgi:hypothetical protein